MSRWIWQQPEWPLFRYDANRLSAALGHCHQLTGQLYRQLQHYGLDLGLTAQLETLIEEASQTSAIEGENCDRQRLRSSLARRLGLPHGGLPAETPTESGLADLLLDATGNPTAPLTAERLFGWHAALFPTGYAGLQRIAVGSWRTPQGDPMQVVSGAVGHEKVHYVAPPAAAVATEMDRLFLWWEATRPGNPTGGDYILRSAIAHYWLVAIHPFEDGNGRLARALADLALAQGEGVQKRCYSLSAAIMHRRANYYAVLDRTSRGHGDLDDWLGWYLQIHAQAVERSLQLIDQLAWGVRFWRSLTEVELNPRQRKVLGKLIERGPDGFEGGLTRRKYVAMTGAGEATAARDLAALVEAGVLVAQGRGRGVVYRLCEERGCP